MQSVGKPAGSPDPKRYLWVLGLIAPASALLPSQLVLHTGLEVFWWIGPIIVLAVIPILDRIVGEDGSNPRDEDYERLSNDRYYRWCTYLFLPVQMVGLLIASAMWAGDELSTLDKLGLAATLGFVSGIGINAAHELGHRVEHLERWLAKVALAQSGYGHFFVEHNRGHHVRVATPEDPASARLGESLWEFLPRTVTGGFRSAVELERARLARQNRGWWSVHNHILQAWSMTVVLFGALVAGFGISVLPWLILQAVIGAGLLEAVNYVEHYGLLRERRPNGLYKRCSPRDSWNSDRLVTNIFLFHLQRHSDHHANPGRRYQTLRTTAQAPQLPAGYATMLLCAAIPPLWRAVMDKRVLAHYDGDITRANISPRKRERLVSAHRGAEVEQTSSEGRRGAAEGRSGVARPEPAVERHVDRARVSGGNRMAGSTARRVSGYDANRAIGHGTVRGVGDRAPVAVAAVATPESGAAIEGVSVREMPSTVQAEASAERAARPETTVVADPALRSRVGRS